MNFNRRSILKGLASVPVLAGATLLSSKLQASQDEGAMVLTPETIRPFLSDRAKAAADNQIKSTLWGYDVGSSDRPLYWISPCTFLTQTFINTHLPKNHVPVSFAKEWAKLLNNLADNGWEATLSNTSVGTVQLVNQATLTPRLPNAIDREAIAVFSFIFFKHVQSKTVGSAPARFTWRDHKNYGHLNEKLGMDIEQTEGHVGPIREFSDFKYKPVSKLWTPV